MKKLNSKERLAILRAHMAEHDGVYEPSVFVEEASSENHPAHDWFEWDDGAAATAHRLWQARQFVKITVKVERKEARPDGATTTVVLKQPAVVSNNEGQYSPADTETGRTALRDQMLDSGYGLRAWLRRYESVMTEKERRAADRLVKLLEG